MNRLTEMQLAHILNSELRQRHITLVQAEWVKEIAQKKNLSLIQIKALVKEAKIKCPRKRSGGNEGSIRFIAS